MNKKLEISVLMIVILSVFSGCNNTINYEKKLEKNTDGLIISYQIKEIKHQKINSNDFSWFYGIIKIKNSNNFEKTINLKDYFLLVNDSLHANIYINSIASVIIKDEVIGPQKEIKRNVYWSVGGIWSPSNIKEINIPTKK